MLNDVDTGTSMNTNTNIDTRLKVRGKNKTKAKNKNKDNENMHGVFSRYSLTREEKDIFAEYLQHSMNNPFIAFVRFLLADDYLKFIDILSGTTIKIPSSKVLEKDLESTRIYLYVKRNNFTIDSIKSAAHLFNKTNSIIRKQVYRVSRVLGVEDTLEGDILKEYLNNIKISDPVYVRNLMGKNSDKDINSSITNNNDNSNIDSNSQVSRSCINGE